MKSVLMLIAAAIVLQTPLSAGVVVEMEARSLANASARPTHTVITLEGNRARFDMGVVEGTGPRKSLIYRGDREEMLLVDHRARRAQRMDRATIDLIASRMDEMLEHLPPEAKAQLQGAILDDSKPACAAVEFHDTGEQATLQGHATVKYDVRLDDDKIGEYWVTDWQNVGVAQSDLAVFEEMADFLEMAFAQLQRVMPAAKMSNNLVREMASAVGAPLKTRQFKNGEAIVETRLVAVRNEAVAAGGFDLPADYEIVDLEAPPLPDPSKLRLPG